MPTTQSRRLTSTTDRLAILKGIASGAKHEALAQELGMGLKTFEYHLGGVYREFGLANAVEATHLAIYNGLVKLKPLSLAPRGADKIALKPGEVLRRCALVGCAKLFVTRAQSRRKYCCDYHNVMASNARNGRVAHRASRTVVCLHCGKTFRSTYKQAKCCTPECWRQWRNARRRKSVTSWCWEI